MNMDSFKKFIFSGLLIDDTLFSLHKKGIPVKEGIEQSPIARITENDFSPVVWQKAMQMASIYTIIYCIENTMRNFIVERLSERKGLNWWEDCVQKSVKDAVQKLKQSEQTKKYHSSRGDSPISYTMMDNLAQIIVNNWSEFSDIIPSQAWIISRMDDLTTCRNVIMHTGELPQYEVDRIESIARDFIRQLS